MVSNVFPSTPFTNSPLMNLHDVASQYRRMSSGAQRGGHRSGACSVARTVAHMKTDRTTWRQCVIMIATEMQFTYSPVGCSYLPV